MIPAAQWIDLQKPETVLPKINLKPDRYGIYGPRLHRFRHSGTEIIEN